MPTSTMRAATYARNGSARDVLTLQDLLIPVPDGTVAGQAILVQGGAVAVGHYAVQFAKLGGATVMATVAPTQGPRTRAPQAPTTS